MMDQSVLDSFLAQGEEIRVLFRHLPVKKASGKERLHVFSAQHYYALQKTQNPVVYVKTAYWLKKANTRI